jgi:hypothetical protein
MPRRDQRGVVDRDAQFQALVSARGRLAVISSLPFMANGSDGQAAAAVRAGIDWTDRLSLDLADSGFDSRVRRECRERRIPGGAAPGRLDRLLSQVKGPGLIQARGQQRPESRPGLGARRAMNRGAGLGESRRQALKTLARVAPDGGRAHRQPEWVDRSGARVEADRLPTEANAPLAEAETVGIDGPALLEGLAADPTRAWLGHGPAIQT